MADFAAEEVLLGVMVASACNCCDRWVYYIAIIVYILVPCFVMTNTELGRRRLWFDYDHYDALRRCSLGPFASVARRSKQRRRWCQSRNGNDSMEMKWDRERQGWTRYINPASNINTLSLSISLSLSIYIYSNMHNANLLCENPLLNNGVGGCWILSRWDSRRSVDINVKYGNQANNFEPSVSHTHARCCC
jgi:hypothetical protein